MSEKMVNELGVKPIAKLLSYSVAGVEPKHMGIGPVEAVPMALKKAGMKLKDIEQIELNEAFAAQGLAVLRELGIDDNDPRVNPQGGAIALGHPLGASGARLVTTAMYQLQRGNQKRALCTMCVGVGQGSSIIIEKV